MKPSTNQYKTKIFIQPGQGHNPHLIAISENKNAIHATIPHSFAQQAPKSHSARKSSAEMKL